MQNFTFIGEEMWVYKVIKNGTIRKLEYGLLFAFHINYDGTLYRS